MAVQLIIASGKTAVILELLEQVFHQMPFLIFLFIEFALDSVGDTAWNYRCTAVLTDIRTKFLLVIAHICQHVLSSQFKRRQQLLYINNVVACTGGQQKMQRIAQPIHNYMNLCG